MRNSSSGFSLVEILVAMFLLAMILLAVAPLFILAGRSTSSAGEISNASAVAVQRMETLDLVAFDTLVKGGSLTANTVGFFDSTNPDYLVRWRVTDDATPPKLKTVEVRVIAQDVPVGLPKEVSVVSLRAW